MNDTSNDCISRQAAVDEITEYGSGDATFVSVGELKRRIAHLAPAPPEIIRCGDCKYYQPITDKTWGCHRHDPIHPRYWRPDGFCSKAERREE